MKTSAQKKKAGQTGEDLWAWAERSATPVIREELAETEQPGWCRELLERISGRKSLSVERPATSRGFQWRRGGG